MMKCDLHTHSKYSDGVLSPAEIVRRAKSLNLEVISITDHDTIAGLPEGMAAAERYGIKFLKGIELSAWERENTEVHILGYNFKADENFTRELNRIMAMRETRNAELLEKLKKFGMKIDVDSIKGEGTLGRAHIARAMKKAGYVNSVNQAFEEWIGREGKAYVPSHRLTPEGAVEMIMRGGGVPCLAHPMRFIENNNLECELKKLKDKGLSGVEAYYSSYPPDIVGEIVRAAKKFDLIVTGGSDFHYDEAGFNIGAGGAFLDEAAQRVLIYNIH